jgi:hypothetical protein
MVSVIDGYQQRREFLRVYHALYELAEQIFGKGRLCHKNLMDIIVREGPSKIIVDIFPDSNFIEVNREAEFESAMELARKGEEITGKEFTIRTNYQRS